METLRFIAHLDWLAFTLHGAETHQTVEDLLRRMDPVGSALFSEQGAAAHYKLTTRSASGAVVSSGAERMGIHAELSGSALVGVSEFTPTLTYIRDRGGKVSRMDLALDVLGDGPQVQHVVDMLNEGQVSTPKKTQREVKSSGGGHTLYLGSKDSASQVRIYNKQAERASAGVVTESWIRLEVQLRDEAATFAAWAIEEQGIGVVTSSLLKKWVRCDGAWALRSWLYRALNQETYSEIQVSEKRATDTRKWLLTTCVQALARESERDGTILEDFRAMLEYLTRQG